MHSTTPAERTGRHTATSPRTPVLRLAPVLDHPSVRPPPARPRPAIAIFNSLGNRGDFVAPFGFGIIKESTGSVVPGRFVLAAASTVAAGLVYFLKERRSTPSPSSERGKESERGTESGKAPVPAEALEPVMARQEKPHPARILGLFAKPNLQSKDPRTSL
ncbi:hypothetical protein [Pseudarthrobacter sp. Y6]|uniref:hypothetical protein n=1 Tax=Pseudarthrobacter sp. Y6 TaxID=3418422 RepID=UPI003CF3736A